MTKLTTKAFRTRSLLTFLARWTALSVFTVFATPAHAYMGDQLLAWVGNYILAPLGIFAVVIALAASVWRPDIVRGAIYAALICAVIFFIIRMAPSLVTIIQST